MYNNSKVSRCVRYALFAGASVAALSSTAVAQQQQNVEEQSTADASVERIQVTGSRIRRTDIETASPIAVVSSEEIRASGYTRIEDLMATMPQLETAGQNAFVANGAAGVANLNLRGLGANRTLVLINGRRLQPGGVYSQASDVNQIPTALIERVEVMTGGGSSTYGSDAVAGVVNFIMRDDFEGVEVGFGASGYQHDNSNSYMQARQDEAGFDYPTGNSGIDGRTYTIDLTAGSSFAGGRGHASVYGTYRTNDEMLQAERDYSSCALNSAGNACGGSATAAIPNFDFIPIIDGAADFDQEVNWRLASDSSFQDGTNLYNYAPTNHFMRPNDRYTFGSFLEYEVSERFRPYVETSYMHDRTVGQIAESGIFFQDFNFAADSSAFSEAQRAQLAEQFPGVDEYLVYIGKRNVEGGGRQNNLEHSAYRIIAGVDGMLSANWEYDVSFQYGSTSSSTVYKNDFFLPRIGQAIGAIGAEECGEGCVPYNVFEFEGVTPEAAASLAGTAIMTGVTTQRIISGFVSGETGWSLPSSDYNIAAVFGLENREVDFERNADEVYQLAQLAGQGGPTTDIVGGFNVKELFTEVNIPLLEDAPGVDMLSLDLGYRYSDYSTSGGENAYKVGIDWSVSPDWKLRASYNRAVRAPNIAELFAQQGLSLWGGQDGCAGDTPEFTLEQCLRTGATEAQYGNISVSPANQNNQISGGNEDLQPEIADTYTVGIVANPFENFNFSIDLWDIQIENVIGSTGAELIITQCALTGDAQFCDAINRSPAGDVWRGDDGFVVNTNVNLAEQHVRGIDLNANYLMEIGPGTLRTSLNGSYSLKKETTSLPNDPGSTYDCAGVVSSNCFPQPDWRHTVNLSYNTGDFWDVGVKWRYIGGFDNLVTADTLTGDSVPSVSYFDVNAGFQLNDHTSLLVGVNNVLDKTPIIVGGGINSLWGNGNTLAGFHDAMGRYVFANVTFRF